MGGSDIAVNILQTILLGKPILSIGQTDHDQRSGAGEGAKIQGGLGQVKRVGYENGKLLLVDHRRRRGSDRLPGLCIYLVRSSKHEAEHLSGVNFAQHKSKEKERR